MLDQGVDDADGNGRSSEERHPQKRVLRDSGWQVAGDRPAVDCLRDQDVAERIQRTDRRRADARRDANELEREDMVCPLPTSTTYSETDSEHAESQDCADQRSHAATRWPD